MARKHSKAGKKRTLKQRQRKYKGGGWGFTGASSIPGTPGTVSNPQVFTGIGDCRAVQPGYDIPYSQYGASLKGLPGMSGGRRGRSTRKGYKNKTKKQRGGRYGFFPEGAAGVTPNGAAWWAGTYPPVQRIGCEGGSFNPLNPAHTGSSAPAGAADPNYYLKGGAQMAPATYGVGNVDSMYYYAPTGGYANTASTWKDSVGAPVQIQVPYAARAMNQACLTTGGSPPLTGALQTGGRRSRKARRGGAYKLPWWLGGLEVPTSGDNLRGIRNTVAQRTGLGDLFGFGAPAPAPAEQTTTTTGANTTTTTNTTANTSRRANNNVGRANTNVGRGNNNAGRANTNRGNANLNRNTNLGAIKTTLFTGNNNNSSSMPAPPPPSTPMFNSMSSVETPEPQTPPYPPITPPLTPRYNNTNTNAVGTPTPPESPPPAPPSTPTGNGFAAPSAALPSPSAQASPEGRQNTLFSGEGGRTRRSKSRRSKRSALKKKKFTGGSLRKKVSNTLKRVAKKLKPETLIKKYENYQQKKLTEKAKKPVKIKKYDTILPRTGMKVTTANINMTDISKPMQYMYGPNPNLPGLAQAYNFLNQNQLVSSTPAIEEPPSTYVWNEEFPFNDKENIKEAKARLPEMIRAAKEKPLGPFNERKIPTFQNALNEVREERRLKERNENIQRSNKQKNKKIQNLKEQIANMTSRAARVKKIASTPKMSFSPISKFSNENNLLSRTPPPILEYR